MKKIKFVDLKLQNARVSAIIKKNFESIINNSKFISGKWVENFERRFAAFLNIEHVIAVNSGTSALVATLMALGLKPGDEVIIPANTFIATAEAISLLGGRPVFADIDDYFLISIPDIKNKITRRTVGIIPVHLYGQCADMDEINKIANDHELWVIEDACQAHGALYKGQKAGTIGLAGCFSFYPSKNLGAWGEAGAIVTNNDTLADKLRKIRNHGGLLGYQHETVGANFRMDEFQGAVLYEKLKFLEESNAHRRQVAKWYNEYLANLEKQNLLRLPKELPFNQHVYHLYVIELLRGSRVEFMNYLSQQGIETRIHYPVPLHKTIPYRSFNRLEPLRCVETKQSHIVSLPIGEHIDQYAVQYISEVIRGFFERDI